MRFGISLVWHLKALIKSQYFFLIEELQMVTDKWMDTVVIHLDGSINQERHSGLNSISRLMLELKISLLVMLINWNQQMVIMLQKIYSIILRMEILYHGQFSIKLCQNRMDSNTNGTYLMLLKYGLILITHA